jgi:hypothetical protein
VVFILAQQGETVLPWAIAVTIVSAAVAAEPHLRDRLGKVSPKVVTGVLISASVIAESAPRGR